MKNFDDVCSNPNYLNHYFARHADFLSSVVVVLWKDLIPGPAFCFDGKPVLYVHQSFSEPGEFSSWNKDPPHPSNNREYSESEINAAKSVRQVISQYQSDLFINHSNLVAIRSSESPEGICIEFVVVAKHFIPMTEKKLPDEIEGIRTKVTSGWVGFTGRKEQRMMRPILPGAGIGCDTQLILNVSDEDYNPPALGTLGGYYHRNGTVYGVTCAHCVLDKTGKAFHPAGSEVYQPCAMGKIVDAAAGTDLLRGYQSLKRTKTDRQAMQWLIKEIEINPEIRPEDFCGTFVNAKLGPTTNGTVVDVALIQMNKEINLQCNHSAGIPNSPSLLLGDNGTQILDVNDFSNSSFKIYGRGAYSAGTMISILDPRYPEIFIRSVDSNEGGLVFDSIHSAVEMYWQTGDSGTWCWTEEGLLVGMGFAYAIIGGIKYCCILPMSDVVEAIKELLPAENV